MTTSWLTGHTRKAKSPNPEEAKSFALCFFISGTLCTPQIGGCEFFSLKHHLAMRSPERVSCGVHTPLSNAHTVPLCNAHEPSVRLERATPESLKKRGGSVANQPANDFLVSLTTCCIGFRPLGAGLYEPRGRICKLGLTGAPSRAAYSLFVRH